MAKFFMLKSNYNNKYLRYIAEDGEIHGHLKFSEGSGCMSPYVLFEMQTAKCGNGLVNIRCCYNNKYWVRWSPSHWWIVAGADKPQEDQSEWSCTLFKPIYIDTTPKTFRFFHLQLGHYACLWRAGEPYYANLFAGSESTDKDSCDVYTLTCWDSPIGGDSPIGQINDLESRLKQCEQGKRTLEDEISRLGPDNGDLRNDISRLEEDNIYLAAEKSRLESQNQSLRKDKSAFQADKSPWEAENKSLQKDKSALQADKSRLEAEKSRLEADKKNLESDNQVLATAKTKLDGEYLQLYGEKLANENRISTLEMVLVFNDIPVPR